MGTSMTTPAKQIAGARSKRHSRGPDVFSSSTQSSKKQKHEYQDDSALPERNKKRLTDRQRPYWSAEAIRSRAETMNLLAVRERERAGNDGELFYIKVARLAERLDNPVRRRARQTEKGAAGLVQEATPQLAGPQVVAGQDIAIQSAPAPVAPIQTHTVDPAATPLDENQLLQHLAPFVNLHAAVTASRDARFRTATEKAAAAKKPGQGWM
ncbi:hypothetical protein ANO11243_089510 [Dothideomycetidae sp. 11243]|nr:hypothetical protein ANO11243_089510 [fungal sp. No.11243]